jgi:hypothetical protein
LKKEARLLLEKGINSLILGIEHFNRPSDRGRIESVLIFLDHSFEMLLKASILHRGGKIRERRVKQTIGFDACVRKALSDSAIKFLTTEQALTLQAINSLRDAAQHHLVDLSEQHLYLHAQSGVTLFRDLLKTVFDRELTADLPERVLPVSTKPPADIDTLFDTEVEHIKTLLRPRSRRRVEAYARLRGLAILEGSIQGEKIQPGTGDLIRLAKKMDSGESWGKLFPGVASVEFTAKGYGPSLDLRISKKEGTPVHLVPEGTPGATVVAIKRVDELGFYNLSLTQLAENVGLSPPKTTALTRHLNLQSDADCFKQIVIGQSKFNRYSQKALEKLKKELPVVDMQKVWAQYGAGKRRASQ